jgi:hypothetical protein
MAAERSEKMALARRHISDIDKVCTPQLFYTYFYNHAHRLRLEKLSYLELSRSSNGFLKPLLDPDGGFTSETAVTQRFRK